MYQEAKNGSSSRHCKDYEIYIDIGNLCKFLIRPIKISKVIDEYLF